MHSHIVGKRRSRAEAHNVHEARAEAHAIKCSVYSFALQRLNIDTPATCAWVSKRIVSCDHNAQSVDNRCTKTTYNYHEQV